MKQSITKEQWSDLSIENQALIIKDIENNYTIFPWELVTAGQLIEFLADDLDFISLSDDGYIVADRYHKEGNNYVKKELIDALLEATKHKLKLWKR